MGWETSSRKQSLPSNWAVIRKKVLKRDGYRCTWKLEDGERCPNPATDVDHIRRGNDHSMRNLRSLCGYHHDRKSSIEGYQERKARLAAVALKYRRDDVHPAYRQRRG